MKEKIDNLIYERELIEKGYKLICGVDEVGRGPLAGPVVVAACIMPLTSADIIEGVTDSKKLSEKKRVDLSKKIREKAIAYKIIELDNNIIDKLNILNATKKAMKEAIESIAIKPEMVLIDALKINTSVPVKDIIKGDLYSYSIGCASIIAKVHRDELMVKYDIIYPGYYFKDNKGYGTKVHIEALKEIGPCEIHRKTFIKNFV